MTVKTINLTDEAVVHLEMNDQILIDVKDVRMTKDGYLVAQPRVARTGIQMYGGREVGRPQMDQVRVYRPPDEVFAKDSMTSFTYRPITDDHPSVPVTSQNWKDHSAGQSGGEVARDGEFLRVPMVVMDAAVIQKWKDGKAELSVGYTCDLKWGEGKDPATGETYDAVQTTIRANHIAIVKAARGGDKLRIGDDTDPSLKNPPPIEDGKTGEKSMTDKTQTVMVDGIAVEMSDIAASIVQRAAKAATEMADGLRKQLTDITAQFTKLQTDSATAITTATTALATKDAELVTAKKLLEDAAITPAKLDLMVKDREVVAGKARAVLGSALVTDGKSIFEIQQQVVHAKLGDAAKDWKEDQVKASFDTLTAGVASTGISDTARAFASPTVGGVHSNQPKQVAYTAYDTKLTDAWKSPAAKTA